MVDDNIPEAVAHTARTKQLGELLWIENGSRVPFYGRWTYLYERGAVFTHGFRQKRPRASEARRWDSVVDHTYSYDVEVDRQDEIGSVLTQGASRFQLTFQDGSIRKFSITEAPDRTLLSDYLVSGRRADVIPSNRYAQDITAAIRRQIEASVKQGEKSVERPTESVGNDIGLARAPRSDVETLSTVFSNRSRGLGNRAQAERLISEGIQACNRFEARGDLSDAQRGIAAFDAAYEAYWGLSTQSIARGNKGTVLLKLFAASSDPDTLDRAIEALTEARFGSSGNENEFGRWQATLSHAHSLRYARTGNLVDLLETIEYGRAARTTPWRPAAPDGWVGFLSAWATDLETYAAMEVDEGRPGAALRDTEEAIALRHEAVKCAPDDDPDPGGLKAKLSRAYALDARAALASGMVERAAASSAEAVRHQQQASSTRVLHALAHGLPPIFTDDPSTANPGERAQNYKKLLDVTAGQLDEETHSRIALRYASSLRQKFQQSGQASDLTQAKSLAEQAATSSNHAIRAEAARVRGVCLMLEARSASDYTRAIAMLRDAVSQFKALGESEAARLTRYDLSIALRERYETMRSLPDLDEAISLAREARAEENDANPFYHSQAECNLGISLQIRYRHSHAPGDLDESIACLQRSVSLLPDPQDARRCSPLQSLCLAFLLRFEGCGDANALDQSIETGRGALELARHGDVAVAGLHSNLGLAYRHRAERTGCLEDFDAAIQLGRRSVEQAADPTMAATARLNLARALSSRGTHVKLADDISEALELMATVLNDVESPPYLRLRAAVLLAVFGSQCQVWEAATLGSAAFVDLLEQVVWHGLPRSTREELLRNLRVVVPDGVAVALRLGRLEDAVALLERGREILWSQHLQLREPLDALKERAPEFALEFSAAAQELGSVFEDDPSTSSRENRQHAAVRVDDVVAQIRALAGFETFLRRPQQGRFQDLVSVAPVVLINVCPARCDAIVITQLGIRNCELTTLTHADVVATAEAHLENLYDLAHESNKDSKDLVETRLAQTIEWLRINVTDPVLDELEHMGLLGDEPRARVLWCPTGLLTLLPIHAAALDRVTSSYVSNVNATSIAYSAAREKSSVPSNDCVLVVGVPEAASSPGRLEAVQTECDDLKARFGDRAEVLIGPNATRERIVRNLSEHAFVHFACRGHVSSSNPAASALLLYDHPLSVQDIASLQLDGELAFLSACNTALGSEGLPDETIHIAAALQVAGIRHVIATFWTILDSAASSVTQVMYEELALSGAPAADDVARRVHSALLKIRSTYEDRTSIWSTYAHFGV